jgi:hypothetical protein
MFHNIFLKKVWYLLHLLDITGPNVLSKTYMTYLHKHWDMVLLHKKEFHISQEITMHHQMNSWMGDAAKMWELFLLVGVAALTCVAVGFAAHYFVARYLKQKRLETHN